MNLLLIGHSVVDKILSGENEIIKPGGIYYSAFGLSFLSNKNDRLKLVTQLDDLRKNLFENVFSNFDTTLIEPVAKVPTVKIKLFEDKEREEQYLNFANKIDLKELQGTENFDGILVNMITGNDITVYDLSSLRRKYDSLIYLDVHSLAKQLDAQNKMQLRQIPDVEKWLNNIDILQANELEARSIISKTDDNEIAEFVLSSGPKIFIITKGSKGASVYYKSSNEIKSLYCTPVIGKTINPVGCGDIFGAAFFYNYLLNRNAVDAAKFANTIAGLSTKTNSEKDLINELKDRKILK
ncbi:MAG: carbohydrate kinase family protein [Ignavibacteriae bacterium]|nr:carbohydrate kinase family protein [Ignavibacteriota bacterium]NOG97346.1 carbohydrate kinase family protein [Ignavibacteriota bacterium]